MEFHALQDLSERKSKEDSRARRGFYEGMQAVD